MENIQCHKCNWVHKQADIIWIPERINNTIIMIPYCQFCRTKRNLKVKEIERATQ